MNGVDTALLILIFGSMIAMLISTAKQIKLHNAQYRLDEFKMSNSLWKFECVLRDFILAYDDQEPEQLLGAYQEAEKLLEIIRNAPVKSIDTLLEGGDDDVTG